MFTRIIQALGLIILAAGTANALTCDQVNDIPRTECLALRTIYDRMNGPNWRDSSDRSINWFTTPTACSWAGVGCNSNRRIDQLDATFRYVQGSVPVEIASLAQLTTLQIGNPYSDGTDLITGFPTTLAQLTALVSAELNAVNASLDPVANIPNLNWLKVKTWNNSFSQRIFTHPSLTYLYIDFHNPTEQSTLVIPRVTNIAHLFVYGEINVTLSPQIVSSPDLSLLHLNLMRSVQLPPLVNQWTSLNELQIGITTPTPFPTVLSTLPSLERLFLYGFSGPVPAQYMALSNLRSLALGSRFMTGTVPTGISQLSNLRWLSLRGKLTGTIPNSFLELRNLEFLSIGREDPNGLEGLSGPIPAWLAQLPELDTLDLDYNQFSGTIPGAIISSGIRSVELKGNRLIGPLPIADRQNIPSSWLDISKNPIGCFIGAGYARTGSLNIEETGLRPDTIEAESLLAQRGVNWRLVGDNDGDHVHSHFEDQNENCNLSDDDLDGDGSPNYRDEDDDGDTLSTRSEIPDPNGDRDPLDARDANNDAVPDYLQNGPWDLRLLVIDRSTRAALESAIINLSGVGNFTVDTNGRFQLYLVGNSARQLSITKSGYRFPGYPLNIIPLERHAAGELLIEGERIEYALTGVVAEDGFPLDAITVAINARVVHTGENGAYSTPIYHGLQTRVSPTPAIQSNYRFLPAEVQFVPDGSRVINFQAICTLDADGDGFTDCTKDLCPAEPRLSRLGTCECWMAPSGNTQDTDGDGVSDADEARDQTNPCSNESFLTTLRGTVTEDGHPLSQITIAVDNHQVRTGAQGSYQATIVHDRQTRVTPSPQVQRHYRFVPDSVVVTGQRNPTVNFAAVCTLDADNDGISDCSKDLCTEERQLSRPGTCGCTIYPGGNTQDADGDGATDSEEQRDETDPCDSNSFLTLLRSPAYVRYNTFLKMWSFLELQSTGTQAVTGTATIYDIDGGTVERLPFQLNPGQQRDLDIHATVGHPNTYGLIRLDFTTSATQRLMGRISHYRYNRESNEFAFARELRNAEFGTRFASANTADPLGRGFSVPNWGEVVNLDHVPRTFEYRLYDQNGTLRNSTTFRLGPFAARDFQAGHEFESGGYLAEFRAESNEVPFLGGVSRYAYNEAGTAEREPIYAYAFTLDARNAIGTTLRSVTSNRSGTCWSQTNWLELTNVLEQPLRIDARFFSSAGTTLGETELVLRGRSQFHLNSTPFLERNTSGSVHLEADQPNGMLAQSVVYYHDCQANSLQSAYASLARVPNQSLLFGTFNNNFGIDNFIHVISSSTESHQINVSYNSWLGRYTEDVEVGQNGSQVFTLDSRIPNDAYGSIELRSPQKPIVADVLRTREVGGKIDVALSTPFN